MRPIMVDFPLPIVTPRLLLRQPIIDAQEAQEYLAAVTESLEELRPWLAWAQYYPTINQVEFYLRESCANWITKNNNNVGLPLWITMRETGKFIGHIVMWNIVWEVPKFEFGFWLRHSYTHQGYMLEATNALTRYCFLELGVRRIEIRCDTNNIRSQLVPKRLGFKLEGTLRNNSLTVNHSSLADIMVFARLNSAHLPPLAVQWGKQV